MAVDSLVVIPTYNERENIARMVNTVLALMPAVDVLIVDDNSPDGTGTIADTLVAGNPGRVFVLHRSEKNGHDRAVCTRKRTQSPHHLYV